LNAEPIRSTPPLRDFRDDIDRACARIAPSWPLDQLIAVNPFWGWIEKPLAQAAAQLEASMGSRLLMPRAWYREQLDAGRFSARHLRAAIELLAADGTPEDVIARISSAEPAPARRALLADLADARRDEIHQMRWTEFVTHHVSQLCASYFDAGQAQLRPDRAAGLYPTWLDHAARDHSPWLLMGLAGFRSRVRNLPADPHALIAQGVEALGIPEAQLERYFTALLLSINGWAAWCAYLRWQARLAGADDDHIVHLLAIRLAWEWILHDGRTSERWRSSLEQWPAAEERVKEAHARDWLAQEALEIAYQERVASGLVARAAQPAAPPQVQAVFCIDVRSEVFRRALESGNDSVQTLGFAGFFGMFIDYRPLGAPAARPHLPALFPPRLRAADTGAPQSLGHRRERRLQAQGAWKHFKTAPTSCFSFVEAIGPMYAAKLAADGLGRTRPAGLPDRAGLTPEENALRKPRLVGAADGSALSTGQRAMAAAGALRAMGLTRGFARLVVFVGHGSQSVNNPSAAGLDCGACCGQTGEVNARVAAALLHEPGVRCELAALGIEIPATTHFLPALHNTTTDEVALFDLDELPPTHGDDVRALQGWLQAAGERARAERAAGLSIAASGRDELLHSMTRRARDWSQVRPEWGLANCAAFVVAPRERTRHIDLAGRAFLHDYRWQDDADFSILELIMTAPMVVAHWINMQYYASTVDNSRWGSGNKVLHNIVGARIGVFEGNGGDLRIGLPMQSVHDGRRFVHEPLRLSVFIEAPRPAIDAVIAKHGLVRQLVENRWLHLFQFDPHEGTVHRRMPAGWREFAPSAMP